MASLPWLFFFHLRYSGSSEHELNARDTRQAAASGMIVVGFIMIVERWFGVVGDEVMTAGYLALKSSL